MQLVVWCLFLFTTVTLSEGVYFVPEHSLASPYDETNQQLSKWLLVGSKYHPDRIELTAAEPNSQGAVWNNIPCNNANWEMQVAFKIHGGEKNSYGNGMALWYVKDPAEPGPVFGSKNFFSGLGVFIDTFENPDDLHEHRHPYISAMVSNGTEGYGHNRLGTFFELGGCHANIRNRNFPTRIAITYSEETLTVYIDSEGIEQWVPCFSTAAVRLPTGYFLGVSASAGEVPDRHEVLSVTTLFMPQQEPALDKSNIVPSALYFRDTKTLLKDEEPEEEEEEEEDPHVEPEVEETVFRTPESVVIEEPKPAPEPKIQEPKKSDSIKKEEIAQKPKRYYLFSAFVIIVTLAAVIFSCKWWQRYRAKKKEIMHKRLY